MQSLPSHGLFYLFRNAEDHGSGGKPNAQHRRPAGVRAAQPQAAPGCGICPRSANGGCTASSVGLPVPPATFVCIKWPINNGRVHLLLLEKHFRWMVITGTRILEDHFNCIFPGCVSRATVFPRDVKLRTSVYRDDA